MSFAQFLTLLVAACLVLVRPAAGLQGLAFGVADIAQLAAAVFGTAVVLHRRGLAQWLPVAGWLALGAALAWLVLPSLGVAPGAQAAPPGLAWAELGWRLAFLALLLRGQPGWGDGALLALCVGTSHAGTMALALPVHAGTGDWRFPPVEALAGLGTVAAGLGMLLAAGLALAWATATPPLRRLPVLAWLGWLSCLMQGVGLLRPWLASP